MLDEPNANKGAANAPQIKFHEVLGELISEGPYNHHRRAIWEHVGVSSAALSQYVLGRARPRFETLSLLADFFGVSLDYLVLGKDASQVIARNDEQQSAAHYVDSTMDAVREHMSAHTWFVARIGQAMAERIDDVAKQVLPGAPHSGDILADNDIVELERLSLHSKMIAPNLHRDFRTTKKGTFAGRFARIASENLSRGRTYQVLLPDIDKSSAWIFPAYRKVLADMGATAEQLKRYRFLITDVPVFTGVYLYQLDLVQLASRLPFLHEAVRPYVSDQNWIGFTRHQHDGAPAPGVLYEATNLVRSLDSFDQLWARGQRDGPEADNRNTEVTH